MATLTIRLPDAHRDRLAARPEPEQADGSAVGAVVGRTRHRSAVPDNHANARMAGGTGEPARPWLNTIWISDLRPARSVGVRRE